MNEEERKAFTAERDRRRAELTEAYSKDPEQLPEVVARLQTSHEVLVATLGQRKQDG